MEIQASTFNLYIAAVLQEARLLARQIDWSRFEVDSLYFGGGTPSLLSTRELEYLISGLKDIFTFRTDAELAIEAAPNATDEAKLSDLRSLGFSRISFGIQSFQDDELQAMGRNYESSLGCQMINAAIHAGFPNVNLDLIFGLPLQSPKTWEDSLRTAVALGSLTITIYPLTLRERTSFGRLSEQSSENFSRGAYLYSLYDIAKDFLSEHQYDQHTMAAFAKPGGGCRHEANEFSHIPTLGLGVAALTYGPTVHYASGHYVEPEAPSRAIASYLDAVGKQILPIRSGFALDNTERKRRHLIMGLLYLGLDRSDYASIFSEEPEAFLASELDILREQGCLMERDGRLALTQRGRRFSSLVVDLLASENVKTLAASYK